jgi:hypothetical protein
MLRSLPLIVLAALLAAPASAHELSHLHGHPHGMEMALGLIATVFVVAAGLFLRERLVRQRRNRK